MVKEKVDVDPKTKEKNETLIRVLEVQNSELKSLPVSRVNTSIQIFNCLIVYLLFKGCLC